MNYKLTWLMILPLIASLISFTGFIVSPAAGGYDQAFSQVSHSSEGKIETGDLETFTDELLERQLAEYHIAGAMVSIVQGGKIELAKGYGYADVAEQIPVTPDETIFRIGSTSKLFTWTAVMQLAEQGKIDLNADVNTYLPDIKIPNTFPEPVTMLNLLSHTAGFEDRYTGMESPTLERMLSLHDALARYIPDRVRPVGEIASYSNYGTALAGYIVEAVSGLPFEQYVGTYIFEPLSMAHSTFRQPLPAGLESHLAAAYSFRIEFVPGTFTYVNLRPAGAMSSTAKDMANFMLAHLNAGRLEDRQILKPETVRQMHSHLFSNDDRLDGLAYGFKEWNFNGQRVLYHNGDIGNYHSALAIFPEVKLGFFVSYNSNESIPAVNEFYSSFMEAFFPAQETVSPSPVQSSAQNGIDLDGEYRNTRSVFNHVERIVNFPGNGNIQVKTNPDNTLSISGFTFYEKEPLVYSLPDGSETAIFHPGENGKPVHMQLNSLPMFAFERVSWYETALLNWIVFGGSYLLLLTAVLASFIGLIRRRKQGQPTSHPLFMALPNMARGWALVVSSIFLLVPLVIAIYVFEWDFKSPFHFSMMLVLAIMLFASILVIGPLIFTILAWARRYWSLAGRIHYTLVTVALLGMVWLMYYWRVLGFRY